MPEHYTAMSICNAYLLSCPSLSQASLKARKDAASRLGSKSALADFVNSMCMRALPSWLTLQHVQGLLGLVLGQQEAGQDEDEGMLHQAAQAAGDMLLGLAKVRFGLI